MKRIMVLIGLVAALALMFIAALRSEEKKPQDKPAVQFDGKVLVPVPHAYKNAEVFKDTSGVIYVRTLLRIADLSEDGGSVIVFDKGTPFEGQRMGMLFDGERLTGGEFKLIQAKIKLYQIEKLVK